VKAANQEIEVKHRIIKCTVTVLSLGLLSSGGFAQNVSGTVDVHGFVAPRCGATFAGVPSFSGSISLGELTQTNGTLSPALSSSSATGPAGVATFIVGCTGGGSNVTLSASRLSNSQPPGLPTSSNDIDFTVQAKIALAEGGFATVDYTTAAATPAATEQFIPEVFANVAGNFEVRVFGFAAENGSASLLVAGNYDSVISITVSPAS
jgi:hypothetical protein